MLGAALISPQNEIVHVFGNLEFCKTIEKRAGENVPSTSGISSNSTSSSTHSLVDCELQDNLPISTNKEKATTFIKKTEIDGELFSDFLMEIILPLCILHRTHQEVRCPKIDSIESDLLKFQLVDLQSNYIVVFITNEDAELEATTDVFTTAVLRSLNFHYGPYIHLLDTGSNQVAKIKSRVNRRMDKLVQNFDKYALPNEMLNVNLSFGNSANIQSLAGLFKEIALRISQSMFNKKCRCIFLNSGQIIGSSSSQQQDILSLFEVMDTAELSSLMEFSLSPSDNYSSGSATAKRCLKCQVEQGWIHSSILRRRQLLNVFVFSLTGEIELICLSNADYSLQITAICDLLKGLEKVERCASDKKNNDTELVALIQEVDRLVQKSCVLLQNSKLVASDAQIFINNLPRTKRLIQSLWNRLSGELMRFQGLELPADWMQNHQMPTALSRFTFSRFGSSLSLFSNSSLLNGNEQLTCNSNSTWPSSSLSRQNRTSIAHLDAMRTQLRRLLKELLNEIVSCSFKIAKNQQLEGLHGVVRQAVDRQINQSMKLVLNKIAKTWSSGNPLRPRHLGLDMLAYRFEISEVLFNYSYIPEKHRLIFSKFGKPLLGSDLTIARTQENQLLIQIINYVEGDLSKPKRKSAFKLLSTKTVVERKCYTVCLALFSDYVNVSLALKQCHQLTKILAPEIQKTLQTFY